MATGEHSPGGSDVPSGNDSREETTVEDLTTAPTNVAGSVSEISHTLPSYLPDDEPVSIRADPGGDDAAGRAQKRASDKKNALPSKRARVEAPESEAHRRQSQEMDAGPALIGEAASPDDKEDEMRRARSSARRRRRRAVAASLAGNTETLPGWCTDEAEYRPSLLIAAIENGHRRQVLKFVTTDFAHRVVEESDRNGMKPIYAALLANDPVSTALLVTIQRPASAGPLSALDSLLQSDGDDIGLEMDEDAAPFTLNGSFCNVPIIHLPLARVGVTAESLDEATKLYAVLLRDRLNDVGWLTDHCKDLIVESDKILKIFNRVKNEKILKRIDLEEKDFFRKTILLRALENGFVDLSSLLLQAGAHLLPLLATVSSTHTSTHHPSTAATTSTARVKSLGTHGLGDHGVEVGSLEADVVETDSLGGVGAQDLGGQEVGGDGLGGRNAGLQDLAGRNVGIEHLGGNGDALMTGLDAFRGVGIHPDGRLSDDEAAVNTSDDTYTQGAVPVADRDKCENNALKALVLCGSIELLEKIAWTRDQKKKLIKNSIFLNSWRILSWILRNFHDLKSGEFEFFAQLSCYLGVEEETLFIFRSIYAAADVPAGDHSADPLNGRPLNPDELVVPGDEVRADKASSDPKLELSPSSAMVEGPEASEDSCLDPDDLVCKEEPDDAMFLVEKSSSTGGEEMEELVHPIPQQDGFMNFTGIFADPGCQLHLGPCLNRILATDLDSFDVISEGGLSREDLKALKKWRKDFPENPSRLEVLLSRKTGALNLPTLHGPNFLWRVGAPPAPLSDILRVHSASYISKIIDQYPESSLVPPVISDDQAPIGNKFSPDDLVRLDADTPMTPFSFYAARVAAGTVVEAVKAVCEGRATNAFCCVRPPGHHLGTYGPAQPSDSDTPMGSQGFCILNNVAIGASFARYNYGLKVAIVDFDIHHGNGTEQIVRNLSRRVHTFKIQTHSTPMDTRTTIQIPEWKLWKDENDLQNVAFFSIHGYDGDFYPATGSPASSSEIPLIVNVAIPADESRKSDSSASSMTARSVTRISMTGASVTGPSGGSGSGVGASVAGDSYNSSADQLAAGAAGDITRPEGLKGASQPSSEQYKSERWMDSSDTEASSGKFRDVFRRCILERLLKFSPDLIMLSAGFDGHAFDGLGGKFSILTEADYFWMTEQLVILSNICSKGRLVSVLEGGYNTTLGLISPFSRSILSHIYALSKTSPRRTVFQHQLKHDYSDDDVTSSSDSQEVQQVEEPGKQQRPMDARNDIHAAQDAAQATIKSDIHAVNEVQNLSEQPEDFLQEVGGPQETETDGDDEEVTYEFLGVEESDLETITGPIDDVHAS